MGLSNKEVELRMVLRGLQTVVNTEKYKRDKATGAQEVWHERERMRYESLITKYEKKLQKESLKQIQKEQK